MKGESQMVNINEIVAELNDNIKQLQELDIKIWDDENPEWRLSSFEYNPVLDKVFFKCIEESVNE